MANTINLGSYPTSEGTTSEEKSIYVGNNRFFRILTQSNPDRTIAVLSESTDVFSGTQTLTNVHEQVIINNDKITGFKMKQLSNGDVLIIGSKTSRTGAYVNTAITLRYNDVDGLFEVVSDYDIAQGDSSIYNYFQFNFEIYTDDIILIYGNSASYLQSHIIKGVTSGTLSKTRVVYDSQADSYYSERSAYTKIIDDKIFFSISSENTYQGYIVNMTSESSESTRMNNYNSAVKLDTDRYLGFFVDSSGFVTYNLGTSSLPTTSSGSVMFTPRIDLGVGSDEDRMCDIVPLDRQHFIYFYRPENSGLLYALFLKVIDENYGFVSDNSQAGDAGTGNGILVCNITSNDALIDNYHTGRLVNPISPTQFWVQTNINEFTFLTMSTS